MTDWSERAFKSFLDPKQHWDDLCHAVQTHVQKLNNKAGRTILDFDNSDEDEFSVKGPKETVVVRLTGEPAIQYTYLGNSGNAEHREGGKYTFGLEDGEVCPINASTGESA